jgi:hypothetical protein
MKYSKDVESIDAIINALYASISFEINARPDWERMASLFIEEARLIPPPDWSTPYLSMMEFQQFEAECMDHIRKGKLTERGFIEREISKSVQRFGSIAHVFSTYESLFSDDMNVMQRGINSIQLWYDGKRWWIVNILWDRESEEVAIPDEYLHVD